MTAWRRSALLLRFSTLTVEVGIDLSNNMPQRLTDDLAREAQLLVTMGCGEACPAVPGLRRLDWPLEDPKGKPVERGRAIRDETDVEEGEVIDVRVARAHLVARTVRVERSK